MPIHINLSTRRIRRYRQTPRAVSPRLRTVIAQRRAHGLRTHRSHARITRPRRARDLRARRELHVEVIGLQHKIISMTLSTNCDPLKRPIRNRDLLRSVTILRHAQSHSVFQARPKNRMRLMEVTARIVRMKRSGADHGPINLNVRPCRNASDVERFPASKRRRRKNSQNPRQSREKEASQVSHGDPQGEESTMSPTNAPVNPYNYARKSRTC